MLFLLIQYGVIQECSAEVEAPCSEKEHMSSNGQAAEGSCVLHG